MLDYNNFTKNRQVTKVIRFELTPCEVTSRHLEEDGVLKHDLELQEKKERLVPVINSWVRMITGKALESLHYDFASVQADIQGAGEEGTQDADLKALSVAIAKAVEEALPEEIGKIEKIHSAVFLQDVLRSFVLDGTPKDFDVAGAVQDIEGSKGYLAVFDKFLTSRITALTTTMPKRVLENFDIYLANIPRIQAAIEAGIAPDMETELHDLTLPSYYENVLSQAQIDAYNRIINGTYEGEVKKEKGLAALINEYNQKIKADKNDKPFLRKVKQLKKQILEPVEKAFTIETINSDAEARDVINEAHKKYLEVKEEILELLDGTDGTGVYVAGSRLHMLSYLLTGDHHKLSDGQQELIEASLIKEAETADKRSRKMIEAKLQTVNKIVREANYDIGETEWPFDVWAEYKRAVPEIMRGIPVCFNAMVAKGLMGHAQIKGSGEAHELVVAYFAKLTELRDALKVIRCPKDAPGDPLFYNVLDDLTASLSATYKAENLVRNYLTRKISDVAETYQTCLGSTDRYKAEWWNGEGKFGKKNAAIIKHGEDYHYFVVAPGAKPISVVEDPNGDAKFFVMKKMGPLYSNMPKFLFSYMINPFFEQNSDAEDYLVNDTRYVVDSFTVSRKVYEINRDKLYTKGALDARLVKKLKAGDVLTAEEQQRYDEYRENLALIIDTYKEFTKVFVQFRKYNIPELPATETFEDIGEFFAELEKYTFKMSWMKVKFSAVERWAEKGEGYLFTITNRFLRKGNTEKNAYTRTLVEMLSEKNAENPTILLNSNPGTYFRPAALPKKVTHKPGSILVDRRTEDGETIPPDVYSIIYKMKNDIRVSDTEFERGQKYLKSHSVHMHKATMDLTFKGHYMEDKLFLNLTYKKNTEISARKMVRLNDEINTATKDQCNVLSIARTMTDLVYLTVMDQDGKVLEEKSLNTIDGTDYRILLRSAQQEKAEAKKLWDYSVSTKDGKNSYIELAITEIIKTAKKYNAVISVEAIDDRTKDKYVYLDTAIFKRFEQRLVERLSDATLAGIKDGEAGSISNPLQLCLNNGNSYQDGIVNFVKPIYTRAMDPDTGFVDLFDKSRINSTGSKRQFLAKMDSITFDGDRFLLSFNYENFPTRLITKKTKWTVELSGIKTVFDREKGRYEYIEDVVQEIIIPEAKDMDLSGNIAERIMDRQVPGTFVEVLYREFCNALFGYRHKTSKCEPAYVSPVTKKEYSFGSMNARNLARKYLFRRNYEGDRKVFQESWIDYVQGEEMV